MKVLITGSSGYLGSILANSLISKKIPVVGLDILNNSADPAGDYFTFYRCSITNRDEIDKIFLREQPTHVVHFACTFNKVRDRKKEQMIDIGGSSNILNASNMTPSVRQLIYSSSAAAYGGYKDNPEWIKETDHLRPGKYRYGINKKLIEQSFTGSGNREDLRIAVLRICSVTGPEITSERIVVRLLTRFPFLPSFCRNTRMQLLHEEDFLSVMELILQDDLIEGIYNIAPDTSSRIIDLVSGKKYFLFPVGLIKAILWLLWHLKILNLQPAAINNSFFPIILDPAKLKNRYNYKFRYSTAEAFAETVKSQAPDTHVVRQ